MAAMLSMQAVLPCRKAPAVASAHVQSGAQRPLWVGCTSSRRSSQALHAAATLEAPQQGVSESSLRLSQQRSGLDAQLTQVSELLQSRWLHYPALEVPSTRDEALVLLERVQQEAASRGTCDGINVVAFTGGNGPALIAYLLASVFEEATVACIGNPAELPQEQVEHARYVTDLLGLELLALDSEAWQQVQRSNSLDADPEVLCESIAGTTCKEAGMVVFSGATADDVASFSGKGGVQHGSVSPLAGLSRATVNVLAKLVGLPEWLPTNVDILIDEPQVLCTSQLTQLLQPALAA